MAAPLQLEGKVRGFLSDFGFEVYPFKVGWYNSVLPTTFHLSYPEDTLAFVVLSIPSMFEKTFKPFISQQRLQKIRDPIDECISYYLALLKKNLEDERMEIIHDYELQTNRKPKFLAQTAAHVAGAAYYYQRKDVKKDPWGAKVNPQQDTPSELSHPELKPGDWVLIKNL